MANTYCGKICEDCAKYQKELCPGCKQGPGKITEPTCEIASCCATRNISSCNSCRTKGSCIHTNTLNNISKESAAKKHNINTQNEHRLDPVFLEKRLSVIYYLSIALLVCAVIPEIGGSKFAAVLTSVQSIIATLSNIAISILLITMASQHKDYKTGGWLWLIGYITSFFATRLAQTGMVGINSHNFGLGTILASVGGLVGVIIYTVLDIISIYKLYYAHSDIMSNIDPELSQKWRKLFVLNLVLILAQPFASVIITLPLALMEIDTIFISAILSIGFAVPVAALKCIYLNRMVKHFRRIKGFIN